MLDRDSYLPCFGLIPERKVHDVSTAHQMNFASGTIVVDDRGYNGYRLFAKWTAAQVFFVTRMKDNARFEIVEEHAVPQNRHILKDQTIRLAGSGPTASDRICCAEWKRSARTRETPWCFCSTTTGWVPALSSPFTRIAGRSSCS